jgi:hypothetical protein
MQGVKYAFRICSQLLFERIFVPMIADGATLETSSQTRVSLNLECPLFSPNFNQNPNFLLTDFKKTSEYLMSLIFAQRFLSYAPKVRHG